MRYSIIRPGCGTTPYKEIICVFTIAMVILLDRIILFPKLYLKRHFLWYWVISISLLFFIGFVEILLVKSNIFKAVKETTLLQHFSRYLFYVFLLVTFRYAAIFALFFIRKIHQKTKFLLLQQQKLLALEEKLIFLDSTSCKEMFLTIDDITYISVDGNYSIIHLINKQEIRQIQSLKHYEDILPENIYLRINRNTIIMYQYVCEFADKEVTLRINNRGEKMSFSFFQNKNEKIIRGLKKHVTPEIKKINCNVKNDENNTEMRNKNDEICNLNKISRLILETIQAKPNIYASEIKSKLPKSSKRTIDTQLQQMKTMGLIVYKGSRKKGGYYLA
jgi:hypothetical protein